MGTDPVSHLMIREPDVIAIMPGRLSTLDLQFLHILFTIFGLLHHIFIIYFLSLLVIERLTEPEDDDG